MRISKKAVFLIIPSMYFLLGAYIHQIIGLYSLRAADPDYIYFVSGVSVACGKLHLGHIDNPGTPLQYLAALVFRMVYILRNQNGSFLEDVLTNPDLYLQVLNFTTIGLISGVLYFAGVYAKRISNLSTFGLLIQTAPFYTGIIYSDIGRITPENLFPIPVILLSLLLLNEMKETQSTSTKIPIQYGLVSALGLSIKLTYFPLLIIPFVVLKKWSSKICYSLSTLLLFFVIAMPVTLQLNFFWKWIKSLFLHSGNYGKGEQNVIDWSQIIPNFTRAIAENKIFFVILILLIIAFLTRRLKSNSSNQKTLNRITMAVLVGITAQVALVCKQFETRYFAPIVMLTPMMLILILKQTQQWHLKIKNINLAFVASILFVVYYGYQQKPLVEGLSDHFDHQLEAKMEAWHFMETIENNAIKILVPGFYGCPAKEYALMTSYGWAGKQKPMLKPVLATLYPNTFIYQFWDKTINYWGKEPQLTRTTQPIYIYINHEKYRNDFEATMQKYFPEDYNLVLVFAANQTDEVIFELKRKESKNAE